MSKTLDKRGANRQIFNRMWQGWVRPYRGQLAGTVALMAFVAATAAAYPLLTKYIFNALADGRASDVILYAPPVIILLALLKGLALFATLKPCHTSVEFKSLKFKVECALVPLWRTLSGPLPYSEIPELTINRCPNKENSKLNVSACA